MRVTTDSALVQALSRFQEGQKAAERARFEDAQAGKAPKTATDAAARVAAQRKITAPIKTETVTERPAERDERETTRFSREAPNGERPRFTPKGQSVNVLA